ncbi:MAG: alpha/beta hydrolase [Streptosporangiaceae bacterium]
MTRTVDKVPGRVRRAAAALVAAATVLVGGCSAVTAASGATTTPSASPAGTPSPTASPTPTGTPTPSPTQTARTAAQTVVGKLGTFWTGQHWYVFTEPAHTGPTGERLGPRRLLTQLLYPLAGRRARRPAPGPRPLLVFAPGFMQCGAPYTDMLRAWASAGYVVAIVNFPNSDCKTPAPTESDMVNQPTDMSYVITRMLRLSASARGLFAGLLDPHEVAVTGQSDGGDTVAGHAAHTRRPVPMLFTQGSADSVNFPGCSIQLYRQDPALERYYLNLFGATHTGPYWGSNGYEHIVVKVTLAFFNRYVLGRAAAGPAMVAAGDVGGLSALYAHGDGDLTPSACDN